MAVTPVIGRFKHGTPVTPVNLATTRDMAKHGTNTMLNTKLECALIALRNGYKRIAQELLRDALSLANKEAPHYRPFIMRAMNHARAIKTVQS